MSHGNDVLRLTVEQRVASGAVLDDDETMDMDAPADLVAYVRTGDGEEERGRRHYETASEACAALLRVVQGGVP